MIDVRRAIFPILVTGTIFRPVNLAWFCSFALQSYPSHVCTDPGDDESSHHHCHCYPKPSLSLSCLCLLSVFPAFSLTPLLFILHTPTQKISEHKANHITHLHITLSGFHCSWNKFQNSFLAQRHLYYLMSLPSSLSSSYTFLSMMHPS